MGSIGDCALLNSTRSKLLVRKGINLCDGLD